MKESSKMKPGSREETRKQQMQQNIHGGDIYSRPVRLDFSVNGNPLGMPAEARVAL